MSLNAIPRRVIDSKPDRFHGYEGWFTLLECGHVRFVSQLPGENKESPPSPVECGSCTLLSEADRQATVAKNQRKALDWTP